MHHCKNCRKPGHNRLTCPNPFTVGKCEQCDRPLTANESQMCSGCYSSFGRIGMNGRSFHHCGYCGIAKHNILTCPERKRRGE